MLFTGETKTEFDVPEELGYGWCAWSKNIFKEVEKTLIQYNRRGNCSDVTIAGAKHPCGAEKGLVGQIHQVSENVKSLK